jgi:hypothetical protein
MGAGVHLENSKATDIANAALWIAGRLFDDTFDSFIDPRATLRIAALT